MKKWKESFFIGSGEIRHFAKKIGDDNPLHSSPEVAMDAGFDDIIVPGAMIDSFITKTILKKFPVVLVRRREIEFLKPLYEVSVVQIICTIMKEKKSIAKVEVEVYSTGDDLVAKGSCLLLIPQMRKRQQKKEPEKEMIVVV